MTENRTDAADDWLKAPKHVALKRLAAEGREGRFRERQREIRSKDRKVTRTDAFYEALREFPPLV